MAYKRCAACHQDLPIEKFALRGDVRGGRRSQCNTCRHWKASHGISLNEFRIREDRQGGVCAICRLPQSGGRGERLYVDHDHATGKIRGLLCHSCNSGIGMLGDSPERIDRASKYLRDSSRGIGAVA